MVVDQERIVTDLGGLAGDVPILDAPDLGIAVPAGQILAVEEADPAVAVGLGQLDLLRRG
jgi:hypothetical protein